jgi:hypothetical protein
VTERDRQFLEVYRAARVEDQRRYYERSTSRYEAAHRQLLLASSAIFGVSAAVSLLAGSDVRGRVVWAILAAVLPAVTTAISAYDGLYAFQRVGKLYRDATRNLRRVESPELRDVDDERAALARYVAVVEGIFANERAQWGQLASEPRGRGDDASSGDAG